MLAAKVGAFDKELRAQLGDAPETREGLRRQLPSNIFVQFLAGPGDIRKRSWVAFEGSRLPACNFGAPRSQVRSVRARIFKNRRLLARI
jgi:hypothetical protein